jgi:type IV pilus assembly protein PilA
MKSFKRGEKGFTLIELLIVVAILGILAAVVIPNVVGLMGRGGKQAYQTDLQVIQLATSTFFSDTHGGWDNGTGPVYTWGNSSDTSANHYYPCALAPMNAPFLTLDTVVTDSPPYTTGKNPTNFRVDNASGGAALDADIQNSAIWMGLLVNGPGFASYPGPGTQQRGNVSVGGNETGLYLQNVPKSAKAGTTTFNGANPPGGGYAWVVGLNGNVYGVYQPGAAGTAWFSGFSGSYP